MSSSAASQRIDFYIQNLQKATNELLDEVNELKGKVDVLTKRLEEAEIHKQKLVNELSNLQNNIPFV